MLSIANAKKAKRTQRNTKVRIFSKKTCTKVSTRAAAAYGQQLKIKKKTVHENHKKVDINLTIEISLNSKVKN